MSPPGSAGRWSSAPTCSTRTASTALIERFERVLMALTADPAQRLSSVDVLDAGERARLDEIGNRAVLTEPASGVSIPALFAEHVRRSPEAVALTFDGRS